MKKLEQLNFFKTVNGKTTDLNFRIKDFVTFGKNKFDL